jgi:2-polyprenyl-3-methyl-5-hydroxy-6-metoxy-1,4-benzoquinol methylase
VGCGVGLVSFEVARRCAGSTVTGVDADPRNIMVANAVKERLGGHNLRFFEMSATRLAGIPDSSCDAVFLIDVLEHVVDHGSVVREVDRVLRPDGAVIISVPTPNYPTIFGREMHNSVGHVRDGYWLDDLRAVLAQAKLRITYHKYYTYPASSLACCLWYRFLTKVGYLALTSSPLLNLVSYLDYIWPIRRPRFACAIAAVARKQLV